MKSFRFTVIGAALGSSLSVAQGGSVETRLGHSMPVGAGSDLWNDGPSVGMSFLIPLKPAFQVGFSANFNSFTPEKHSATYSRLNAKYSVIELGALARAQTSQASSGISAFAQAGASLYLQTVSSSIGHLSDSRSERRPGFHLGGGIQIAITPSFSLILSPTLHFIANEQETTRYLSLSASTGIHF